MLTVPSALVKSLERARRPEGEKPKQSRHEKIWWVYAEL